MGFYLKYYRNKTGQSTTTRQTRRRAATYTYTPTFYAPTYAPTLCAPTYAPTLYTPVYTTITPKKTKSTKSQTNK